MEWFKVPEVQIYEQPTVVHNVIDAIQFILPIKPTLMG